MEHVEQNLNPLPPALADWRIRNKALILQIAQRRNLFKVSDPIPLNSGKDYDRMGIQYSVEAGEKKWNVFIHPDIQFSPMPSPTPFTPAFEIRQDLTQLTAPPEKLSPTALQRQQTVDFLAANWSQLVRIFYQKPTDEAPANLPCFTEVKLNNGETVAFIGIGPDGKIVIIDIYDPKNPKNFNDYLNQINSLLKNLAHPLKLSLTEIDPKNLSVYSISSSFTNSANNLIIASLKKPPLVQAVGPQNQ